MFQHSDHLLKLVFYLLINFFGKYFLKITEAMFSKQIKQDVIFLFLQVNFLLK